MYDPQNARMLSADPILHDATSSQAYNKYSYCINNPLKYTDPSGYDFKIPGKKMILFFIFLLPRARALVGEMTQRLLKVVMVDQLVVMVKNIQILEILDLI